ncbi:12-oxophytodienoate reductase 1 [Phytophthora pseudosyringae]|uniref:12-oxophytodienoate reductase 1 n=1 Tax=Phytophthora pseudosyringae TaxID=221518 RepID=A0A8T1VE30_9STRA|nr:12-oxophytodienoate reductase 1 [Phytophthora pseudosyringae]
MAIAALPKLFTAATLGGKNSPTELKHRVVMAPMTRLRMGDDGVPGAAVVEFYSQRATDGGLLVTEGTNISATARGYYGAPGIFNSAQVEGWKAVTEAVHAKGGKIFVQLWHTGRVSHQLNQPHGELPVCSSAVSMEGVHSLAPTREGRLPHPVPRALETDEIGGIVADYKSSALLALDAGFDGVELHCANGYLMEQFLCDSVNKRTDRYGGSVENRARILFEALEAVLSGVDSNKVGIRLSPYGTAFGCSDSAPGDLYSYVIEKLNDYDLAYLHLVEPRGIQVPAPDAPEGGVLPIFRKIYPGFIITASGYDRAEAIKVAEDGSADCVAFASDFISNPDLVERLKLGSELNKRNQKTVYLPLGVPFETGYTDYPFLTDSKKQ